MLLFQTVVRPRLTRNPIQNKRRKFQDELESQEEAPDPLANATTLYVGNLYGYNSGCMVMVV
jgi:hypothetical protein